MSHAEATARAQQLRTVLLDHGIRAVSIELVAGRSGSGWSDDRFVGSMGHHIVSHRGQGDTPGLRLVKVGRSDLPGPLCNGYGGFDEIARIVCMAWANHSGYGGPYTVEAGTIPKNNGRPYFFGWEFEGGIREADWTPSMRQFMARCLAGTLDWLGATSASHIEHKTWAPSRKIDRLNYTLSRARQEIDDQENTMTELQARLEIATEWHARTGEWMTGATSSQHGREDPQERLTRLAREVSAGKRTVGDIVRYAGSPKSGRRLEPVPSWVLDPYVPYGTLAASPGGLSTGDVEAIVNRMAVVKGQKVVIKGAG